MSFGLILLIAIGGAFAFEGVMWAIFPSGIREVYRQAFEQMTDRDLHLTGLSSVAIGVAMIAFAVKVAA